MPPPDDQTKRLQLNDGRQLAFCTRGDPASPKAIWFDGTPGSRLTAVLDDEACERFGLCVATFDRPGYGRSDPKRGRSVADVADDVAQLTEHLRWDNWIAFGYSGGGPHALACGASLATQVRAVVAIATVGPPHELADWTSTAASGASVAHATWSADPERFEQQIREMRDELSPDPLAGMMSASGDDLSPADAGWLAEPDHYGMFNAALREALRPSHHGWHDDKVAIFQPWGFALEDIRVPVHLLHGSADSIAPITHMRQMADRIPDATVHEIVTAAHLSVLDHLDRLEPFITEQSFEAITGGRA